MGKDGRVVESRRLAAERKRGVPEANVMSEGEKRHAMVLENSILESWLSG